MNAISKLREVLRVLGEVRHILPAVNFKMPASEIQASFGSMFQDSVAAYPNNVMLLCEGRQWTFAEFNVEVNRLAHLLDARGVKRGECVALLMENRAEFVMCLLALAKLGAVASLLNSSLSGNGLVHCIKETGSKKCIVGAERDAVIADLIPQLEMEVGHDFFWVSDDFQPSLNEHARPAHCPDWAVDILPLMHGMPETNPAITAKITAGEIALYVFTSGTTGLPKAALQRHKKVISAGKVAGKVGFRIQPTDRLYLCLPLYHITGFGPGLCGFIANGASIFLRRNFSASQFWPEVQQFNTNCFIYVGELCRYLSQQAVCEEEKNNPLQKIMGNGLRPDVWDEFKQRFGIERVTEIYGSSEGNVAFANLLNKDKTIGAVSASIALVKYDTDNDCIERDDTGRCIEVSNGEPGLLLGEITPNTVFAGYTDAEATAAKIVEGVLKDGDSWFNTGDLVRQIDVGFALGLKHYQFVDRTGDTFRWRAENVSTNEVAEALNAHPQVKLANVYGVELPGTEGRAGMVAVELSEQGEPFDVESFQALIERELPSYAQPVFIRVQGEVATTATFKLLKTDLREQAYHPSRTKGDLVYVRKPRSHGYEVLDAAFYQAIEDGRSEY